MRRGRQPAYYMGEAALAQELRGIWISINITQFRQHRQARRTKGLRNCDLRSV